MANPNNAVGTNGAFGGRTSVNAFNDVLSAFSGRGIVSGWQGAPSSGLTIAIGGDGVNRDVAVAEDGAGNKTTVNNISGNAIPVTLNAAPASNSRIDAVVAYIEDSPQGSGVTDNPDVVNILVVDGTVATTPTRPTDSAIRTAITADGASGSTAYYVVLAYVTIPTGTTDIDAGMIAAGDSVELANNIVSASSIKPGAVTNDKIDFSTIKPYSTNEYQIGVTDNGVPIYRRVYSATSPESVGVTTTILTLPSNVNVIRLYGVLYNTSVPMTIPLPSVLSSDNYFRLTMNPSTKDVQMGIAAAQYASNDCTIIVEYTKS